MRLWEHQAGCFSLSDFFWSFLESFNTASVKAIGHRHGGKKRGLSSPLFSFLSFLIRFFGRSAASCRSVDFNGKIGSESEEIDSIVCRGRHPFLHEVQHFLMAVFSFLSMTSRMTNVMASPIMNGFKPGSAPSGQSFGHRKKFRYPKGRGEQVDAVFVVAEKQQV